MKIAAAFAFVIVLLLGMIVGVGRIDGQFGGDQAAPEQMTGAEEAYLQFVIVRLDSVDTDMGNLGVLFGKPAFDDDDWRTDLHLTIERIQNAASDMQGLQPSERLQPFQDAAFSALSHSSAFAGIIGELLDQQSTELSDEAIQELVAASDSFGDAGQLLQQFLDAHPAPDHGVPEAPAAPEVGGS